MSVQARILVGSAGVGSIVMLMLMLMVEKTGRVWWRVVMSMSLVSMLVVRLMTGYGDVVRWVLWWLFWWTTGCCALARQFRSRLK